MSRVVLPVVIASLFVLACAGCRQTDQRPIPGTHRQEVLLDIGLEPSRSFDDTEAALRAREFVYLTNTLPADRSTRFSTRSDFYPVYIAWKAGDAQFLCGGMSYVHAWMLEELGIPARSVLLATEEFFNGDRFATHVTTEGYIDDQWQVLDPTFNAALHCGSSTADVLALRECNDVNWTVGTQLPGRTLDEYPTPFIDYLFAYRFNTYYSSLLHYEAVPASPPVSDWPVYSAAEDQNAVRCPDAGCDI